MPISTIGSAGLNQASDVTLCTTSGNVGIGTASPASKLDVTATIRAVSSTPVAPTSGKGVEIWYETSGDYGRIATYDRTGAAYKNQYIDSAALYINSQSAGNVGIGTASPVSKLQVVADQASYVNDVAQLTITGTNTNQRLLIGYNTSTDKAFIQATKVGTAYQDLVLQSGGGNLLVGTTSQLNGYNVSGSIHSLTNDAKQLNLRNSNATAGRVWTLGMTNASEFIVYANGSTGVYLTWNATSWTSSSDERLKTNLKPIENAAAKVMSIRAVTGRFKTDDESVSRAFLIAQDVQAVLPEAVNVQDDEIGTLGLQYTDVIPLLVAAIKEQQALITQLQADVAALKGASA